MQRKVYVVKRATFEAAHHLNKYNGECACVHGHSYKVEVKVSRYIGDIEYNTPATDAMVCDFKVLNSYLMDIIKQLDHNDLNIFYHQPTAEVLAIDIFNQLKEGFESYTRYQNAPLCEVESVKVWETENSYAEYKGESQ